MSIDFLTKARQNHGQATLGELLEVQSQSHPDKEALIFQHRQQSLTFGQLADSAYKVAAALLALGVSRQEHAALWAPNLPAYLSIVFGCAKAGVPLVLVNTNYQSFELQQVLQQTNVTTLFIAGGALLPDEYLRMLQEICPELSADAPGSLQTARLPSLRRVIFLGEETQPGMFSWPEFLALAAQTAPKQLQEREKQVQPGDPFLIQHTSGTTGMPKGAVLTHACYSLNICAIIECQKLSPADCLCQPLPFFHIYGLVMTLAALGAGAAVAPIERFQAQSLLEVMEQCHVTQICGTPTMYIAALKELDNRTYNLSALQGGTISGASCSPELVEAIAEKLGARQLGIVYGMTESLCTMNFPEDSLERRSSTVGVIMPDRELKIIDPASGQTVPPGVTGELCVRGAPVIKEYYGMPQETAAVIDADGWLHSGDLAQVDDGGYYSIKGRLKDIIIRGGENIYPAEIERFLFTHPKVADAQVIGIPCAYYGEEVVAFVRLKPGFTATSLELKRFCREHIALIKAPAKFFFVEQYPLSANGKVQKYKLRELALRLLTTAEN